MRGEGEIGMASTSKPIAMRNRSDLNKGALVGNVMRRGYYCEKAEAKQLENVKNRREKEDLQVRSARRWIHELRRGNQVVSRQQGMFRLREGEAEGEVGKSRGGPDDRSLVR